jgi:hypothetical protein
MTKKASRTKARYATHPGYAMQDAIISNLKQKTGKTLEEWIRVVKKTGPSARKERAQWLKAKHRLGGTTAAVIADRVEGKAPQYNPEAFVKVMFAGPRAGLRPIYEQLMKLGMKLGKDVTATPCKTFVPLRRRYVFAQIKPTTNTRIDLGLALGKTSAPKRLLDTGGLAKGDRITYRIPITSLKEIDSEVKRWLKAAYHLDT